MRKTLIAVVLILGILSGMWAVAVRAQGAPSFSITPLQLSFGSSEPEIAFNGGFMAITSLSWLLPNGTQLWTGDFGATPNLQGAIDRALKTAGFTVAFGGGDASVDLGSTGARHATTLVIPINQPSRAAQTSLSAIGCVDTASPDISATDCPAQILDSAGTDGPR